MIKNIIFYKNSEIKVELLMKITCIFGEKQDVALM